MKTKITEMLGIKYPIIQGSMQYMSLGDLAAAVSNAGGLGIVPSMAFPDTEALRAEVRKVKSLTDKPFAFNISLVPEVVVPELIFDYINVLIEEGVPVIETSGQRPANFITPIKEAGIPVIHKVTSIRHAKSAQDDGADILVLVGQEAGGHPGMEEVSGHILWAKAVEELDVPIVAAGGIVDGKSMYSAMSLGVDAVLMGTRFLASDEVNAPQAYKEALMHLPENGTVLTMRSIRNAMRVANNEFAQVILQKEKEGATLKELMPYISGKRSYDAMQEGRFDEAQLSVGQGVGRLDKILPAGEIVQEIMTDFQATHEKMVKLVGSENTVL